MARQTRRYEVLIFLTGAVTLALEVLASRIMTPYFGVSLFIWSGILSITLSFLAIGYWAGGKASDGKTPEQLLSLFLAGPVVASVAIGVAAILYPAVFPFLAEFDLVAGSFAGGFILLAAPIVTLSAMNPLLVALRRSGDVPGAVQADAGAGRVFFVSTVGSVAGVLLTAFVFIPALTNFRAMLLLGVAIGGAALVLTAMAARPVPAAKRWLLTGAAGGMALCLALVLARDTYLDALTQTVDGGADFRVVAQYSSLYGTIKVVNADRADGSQIRLYLQDGLVQNFISLDGVSQSLHTHALEELSVAFAPHARSALVLGLAAGLVPMRFRREGWDITVVDINPNAVEVATRHFGFNAKDMDIRIEDARTHVRGCTRDGGAGPRRVQFDVVVVDLFHGDGTPDYLMTREFFADVARCLTRDGVVVMNTFFDTDRDAPNRRVLATLATAFGVIIEFRSPQGGTFLVATNAVLPGALNIAAVAVPVGVRDAFDATMRSGRLVLPADLAGARPFSDQENAFSFIFARAEMAHRQSWAKGLPPGLLVN